MKGKIFTGNRGHPWANFTMDFWPYKIAWAFRFIHDPHPGEVVDEFFLEVPNVLMVNLCQSMVNLDLAHLSCWQSPFVNCSAYQRAQKSQPFPEHLQHADAWILREDAGSKRLGARTVWVGYTHGRWEQMGCHRSRKTLAGWWARATPLKNDGVRRLGW